MFGKHPATGIAKEIFEVKTLHTPRITLYYLVRKGDEVTK